MGAMRVSLRMATPFASISKPLITHLAGQNIPKRAFSKRNSAAFKLSLPIKRSRTILAATRDTTSNPTSLPSTPTACVEAGLQLFEGGDAQAALSLFQRALTLNPNDDEARAALYNSACALTKLKRWEEAADAVVSAVNDRGLKLAVALRDPDLALLRERREWTSALSRATGGISSNSYMKLRAEAKSPFRFTRIFLFGALDAGAGIGLFLITVRLIAALKGGEGAPDLNETLQNFGINAAAVAVFSFLLYRDFAGQRKDQTIVEREETLAALQVTLSPGRTVPLAAFRGTTRPVIITGSKGQITKALASAEPFKQELRARGISLVPVILSDEDPGEKLRRLKAELAAESLVGGGADAAGGASQAQGFASSSTKSAAKTAPAEGILDADGQVSKNDRRWQLEAAEVVEWERWVAAQAKAAGVKSPGDNYYVQIQLDGSVRASGAGTPPWKQFLDDVPTLSDIRTKLTDGKGMTQ